MTVADWLFFTSIFCTLPVWCVFANCGNYVHPILGAVDWRDIAPAPILMTLGIPAMLLLYLLWPVVPALLYGITVINMTCSPTAGPEDCKMLVIILVALVGAVFGRYLSGRYLPRIDAYFGVTKGFSAATALYDGIGIAYTSYAVAKLGARIIRKI